MQEILNKAIAGDKESFAKIIEHRKESIYRIAYSYVKNSHDALDVVQEAVYKAFVSINNLHKPENFNTWLTRITINCAIDYLRKSKREILTENDYTDTKQEVNNKADVMDLHMALDSLDVKHKTVIILRYFEDLTLQDMANVLDWPISTVKTYLYRALKKLKINLEEGEESEQ